MKPLSGKLKDVTVTVQKTGVGGALAEIGMGALNICNVFGVKLNRLKPYKKI